MRETTACALVDEAIVTFLYGFLCELGVCADFDGLRAIRRVVPVPVLDPAFLEVEVGGIGEDVLMLGKKDECGFLVTDFFDVLGWLRDVGRRWVLSMLIHLKLTECDGIDLFVVVAVVAGFASIDAGVAACYSSLPDFDVFVLRGAVVTFGVEKVLDISNCPVIANKAANAVDRSGKRM